MKKPFAAGEWDWHPQCSIPADRKPLPRDKEEVLIEDLQNKVKALVKKQGGNEFKKIV